MIRLKALHIIAILAIGAAVVVGGYEIFVNRSDSGSSNAIATVNGEPIAVNEFRLFMEKNRANVYSYFKQKYGVDDSSHFWTTEINAEIPMNVLKQWAMDEATKIKVQQILGKQHGIIQDISYAAFLKEFKQENKRRQEAVEAKKVIYGPHQYDEQGYYNYILSGIETQLKETLSKKDLAVSDDQVKAYYEANKDTLYKNQDTIQIQKASISFIGKDITDVSAQKLQVKKQMNLVKERLDQGKSFGEIASQLRSENQVSLALQDMKLDGSSIRSNSILYPVLMETANKLAEGKYSEIYEEDNAYNIIQCNRRINEGYRIFNEIKDSIKAIFIKKKYEEWIDKTLKAVKVEINQKVYNHFSI